MAALTSPPEHHFVIVGGGAGGLPLATALGDKLGDKNRGHADITLVDRFETHLCGLDVSVRADERVTAVDASGVHTANGGFLPADLVVWAAGIQAPGVLAVIDGLEVNRLHQLVMTETLQTTRDPDIFAFGDCAA